jgi:hypothetical protein
MKVTKNPAIAMGACICLLASVSSVKAVNENLLLYLSFDSGDREVARDLTGKTKGGIINGGAKIVPGLRGKALELDGESGYLQIELTPEMIEAERNSFTAELWLKSKAVGPEIAVEQPVKRLRGYLVFGGYGPEEHFHGHWSMFLQNGNNLSFYTINVNSHTSGGPQGVVADNTFHLNDGEWHHIAAVRDEDAKEIRLFINGRLVGAEDERNRSLKKADGGRKHIWIGIHIPNHAEQTGTGFFPATVDEVRFWDIAMTQDDAVRYMALAVDPLDKLPLIWGEVKMRRVGGY